MFWCDGCGCDSAGGPLRDCGACLQCSEHVWGCGGVPTACRAACRWFLCATHVWVFRDPHCGAHQTLPCSPLSSSPQFHHLATEGLSMVALKTNTVSPREELCLEPGGSPDLVQSRALFLASGPQKGCLPPLTPHHWTELSLQCPTHPCHPPGAGKDRCS